MPQKLLILFLLMGAWLQPARASDTIFQLDETSTPLAVRVEKAQGLLRSWQFASTEFAETFRLNGEAGVSELRQALDSLITRSAAVTTAAEISSEADHYLTWAMARAQILNTLDFSDQALRHFFKVNPEQYMCEPTASISELLVPTTYIDTLGSTTTLAEISQRVTQVDFARVAYEFSAKLGKPDTGFLGDVTKNAAGAERFELYRRAKSAGGIGGPYQVAEGYLFVSVHKIFAEGDDCFHFYRDQVVQDYGREWLKKIYADTLTTAARQLNPLVNEVTSVPQATDIAYTVGNHAVTFGEARGTLPFLFGDDKTVAFWQSIQCQALEVELIYHSETGQAIRESDEYREQLKVIALLSDAQKKVKQVVARESTTASILAWYLQNRGQFTETTTVSYTLYQCDDGVAAGTVPETTVTITAAQCAAALEIFRSGSTAAGEPLTGEVVSEKITSQTWASRSREIQVACQELTPGEWSKVFSVDGNPQVLRLDAIERKTPEASEIWNDVEVRYEMQKRLEYWRDFAGLK